MKHFNFRNAFLFLSVFLVVALLFVSPFYFPLLIGGVITSGILGGFSGKVSNVVGANWKGIDYMRGYVIPANPNSAGQQTQRTKFSVAIDLARQILSNVIQPYVDPFVSGLSGFNSAVREFILTMDGSNKLVVSTKFIKGTLQGLQSVAATYTTGSGSMDFVFVGAAGGGNGLATDQFYALVYDKSTQLFHYTTYMAVREDGLASGTIATGLTATNLIAWCWFSQGTGSEMIVSDSLGDAVAAP